MPFIFNDARNDVPNLVENLYLALAQRHLVGDLVEISRGPAAFSIQAPHGQVDFLERPKDLLDVLDHHQRGQVQHDARAHARADVGRAGRQVAEFLGEGVTHALFEQIVDPVNVLPGLVQSEAAAHHLKAKVILFIDHKADGFVRAEGDAARPVGGGQLSADELPLH